MERRYHTRFVGLILALLALAGFVGSAAAMELESWDKKIPLASDRFKVKSAFNNAAVLDKETGLVWEKAPGDTDGDLDVDADDKLMWAGARLYCVDKNVGGRKGWRLPSVVELASLVDPANSNPALPTGHPFINIQSAAYWSASTLASDPTLAWVVFFNNGSVGFGNKTLTDSFVWCVRGPMQESEY